MPPLGTTEGGWLLVLALMLPGMGILAILGLGLRQVERIAAVVFPAGLVLALAIIAQVAQSGAAVTYVLGGWAPPLGVALRADGTSSVLMVMTGLVMCAVGLFARGQFTTPEGAGETRQPVVFWVMVMGVWAGLNAVFLAQDLFSLFVALELLTFSAVPLVCLDGRARTLTAALRYLLFALVGSVLYLLGAGLAGDPVPQAMVITGIVVAFAATALAVALLLRLVELGGSTLEPPPLEIPDETT
jgi:formate hydrogenlyase subunit 3/multisubunit Na+/H+ antiporter MnhD subunit